MITWLSLKNKNILVLSNLKINCILILIFKYFPSQMRFSQKHEWADYSVQRHRRFILPITPRPSAWTFPDVFPLPTTTTSLFFFLYKLSLIQWWISLVLVSCSASSLGTHSRHNNSALPQNTHLLPVLSIKRSWGTWIHALWDAVGGDLSITHTHTAPFSTFHKKLFVNPMSNTERRGASLLRV